MLNIVGYRRLYYVFSTLMVVLAILAVGVWGLKEGIDFSGGSAWQVSFEKSVELQALRDFVGKDLDVKQYSVVDQPSSKSYVIRLPEISEATHKDYAKKMTDKFGVVNELSFESIGPLIGSELKSGALWAFILVLLTISLYVTFVFRKVSYPVKSWKYGVVTLLTLFHDAFIPVGLAAILGHFQGLEVGINLVVAILVVIGFSVHDTIVVLDRTRENLIKAVKNEDFATLVNRSLNQTLARSINTSLTLVIVLLALYFLGPVSLSYFILMILVGVIFGTYSSICVASSLIVSWRGRVV